MRARAGRLKLLLCLLAGMFVLAQAAAVAHGVVHATWGAGHGHHAAHLAGHPHRHASGQDDDPNWLVSAFKGHTDPSGCEVYDASMQLIPPLAQLALATASPPRVLSLRAEGEAKARWAALFDARGPPAFS